jgi:4'-phosphopantetheinyl transferase
MQHVASITGSFKERHLPLSGLVPPAPGVAHLWLLDLAALGSPLQPGEAVDGDKITGRQQRWMRRFYLRLLLGAYLGLPGKDVHIFRGARGKPRLHKDHHDPVLDFSMAGSGSRCLVGITSGAVIGVDLEPRDRHASKPLALARRYFSAQEYEALKAFPQDQLDAAFLHTWACKEAVVKAAGMGIANALCHFAVSVQPGEPAAVLAMRDDDPDAWRLRCLALPHGMLGAVTVRYPELRVEGFELAPRA